MTLKGEKNTDSLYFNVVHEPVTEVGLTGIPGRDHCVIVRPGQDDKIVSLCSSTYELVENDKIFPVLEKSIGSYPYQVLVRNYNDCQFNVRYIIRNESIDLPGGDTLLLMVDIDHSYDTKRRFNIGWSAYRELCSNGLTVPYQGEYADLFNLEMDGIYSNENVKKMLEKFTKWLPEVMNKFGTAVKETYRPLTERRINNYEDRILEVISATNVFSEKLLSAAVAIAKSEERAALLPRTDWLAYNAINNLIFDDEVNKKMYFERKKLDLKVVNYMLSTVG
jgi:hypothetical protein